MPVELFMDDHFRDILNSLPEKSPRSRLEPYGELIDELRRRGRTYRDIVEILADRFPLRVSISTLHDFVRARSRRKKNSVRRITPDAMTAAAPIAPKAASVDSGQKPSDNEVRRRIAAVKARRAVTTPSPDDFHFDPSQPLRLITPGKPESNE